MDLLRGRSHELPEVRSKVVRVFVSSTFSGEFLKVYSSFMQKYSCEINMIHFHTHF